MITALIVIGAVSAIVYSIGSFGFGEGRSDKLHSLNVSANDEIKELPEISQPSIVISILAAVGLWFVSVFVLIGIIGIPSTSASSVCSLAAIATYFAMRKKRSL